MGLSIPRRRRRSRSATSPVPALSSMRGPGVPVASGASTRTGVIASPQRSLATNRRRPTQRRSRADRRFQRGGSRLGEREQSGRTV